MSGMPATKIFVQGSVITGSDGLEAASADDSFYVIGEPGKYEIAGFLIPLDELEPRGVPRKVAREVAMIASLRTSSNVVLLFHGEGLWELLVQGGGSGQSLPDTYTFRVGPGSTGGKSG